MSWSHRQQCLLPFLSNQNNRGYWKADLWYPFHCTPRRLQPKDVAKLLHGKNILMLGASPARYAAAEFMRYITSAHRGDYANHYRKSNKGFSTFWHRGPPFQESPLQYRDGKVVTAMNVFGKGAAVKFHGTFWNGFARTELRIKQDDGKTSAFNLTYITHIYSHERIFRSWMTNATVLNGLPANSWLPFDLVLGTTGLHDLKKPGTAEEFGNSLKSGLLPSLLEVVRDPKDITWTGMWAAYERTKPAKYIPFSNNARGFRSEDVAKKVFTEAGITCWLDVRGMTLSRPDLNWDSTHYTYPVSLATLELWFSHLDLQFG